MFEISKLFQGVVEEAVQESIKTHKPLVVYNAEEDNTNAWIKTWFFKPSKSNGNSLSIEALKDAAVWLKLNKGTTQFEFFKQMFPQREVDVPSVYIIKDAKLSTVISKSNGTTAENWALLTNALGIKCGNNSNNNNDNNDNNTTAGSTSTGDTTQSVEPAELTFKESVNKKTMEIYQKEVQKERRLARLERERILRLVKADREERKARDLKIREKQHQREMSTGSNTAVFDRPEAIIQDDVKDNFKDSEKLHTKECTLLIKLTNSESLTHTFSSRDQLNTVRSWVDLHRTDGDCPYVFHRSIPRVTFTEPDELKSLEELELTPRSVLIVKSLESSTMGRRLNISSSQVGQGLFGRVYNGLYSWWNGGYNTATAAATAATTRGSSNEMDGIDTHTKSEDRQHLLGEDLEDSVSNSEVRSLSAAGNSGTSSRRLGRNIAQLHNADDDKVDDDEKEAYNGNSTNLEKNRDDH